MSPTPKPSGTATALALAAAIAALVGAFLTVAVLVVQAGKVDLSMGNSKTTTKEQR